MSRTITSSSLTFIDNTDSQKLEVFITSNLPTSQIYNSNMGTYSPDWTTKQLILTPTVYMNSEKVTSSATIQWSKRYGTDDVIPIDNTIETLTISSNELSHSSGMVTYICTAKYRGKEATTQLVFTRTDTGVDGTSVAILGVAYTNEDIITGNYYTLYSDSNCSTVISTIELDNGDSYMVDGYLCVYSDIEDKFLCTGQIQGPKGEDAKNIVLSASAQAFKKDKDSVVSPSTITVTAITHNTTINSWLYSIDGGQTWQDSAVGVSQSNNQVIITGTSLTSNSITIKASDGEYSDVFTAYIVSDGDNGISAPTVFLTNENITFAANENGEILSTTTFCNVVAYNGLEKTTPTISTIIGIPDGMSITHETTSEQEVMLAISISNKATFGSTSSNNGSITIPIISPIETNLKLNWSKVNAGQTGESGNDGQDGLNGIDAITFQIYAPDGYLLTKEIPYLTLKTFAYDGNNPINSNVTYVWSRQENSEWIDIDGQNNAELIITKDDVLKSKTYQCAMIYNGYTYYTTATVQDKSDIHDAIICVSSNACSTDGEYYWILYTLVYTDNSEIDPLLGPISQFAPNTYEEATTYDEALTYYIDTNGTEANPQPTTLEEVEGGQYYINIGATDGDYWYPVNTTDMTITLMKYNGESWVQTDESQNLSYNWSIIRETGDSTLLNSISKVQVITSRDFSSTSTFMCQVNSLTDGILAQTTISLTDISDPVLSSEAPINPQNGQIWIKQNADGTFLLFVWDANNEMWVMSDADSRNKVYTSRPSTYSAGDLWITASNEDHGSYLQGTLLQAQVSNIEYNANDWSPTLKYDKDIEEVQTQLNDLNQYITMSSEGLRIRAKTDSGEVSPYNSLFTSTKLAFCDGDTELLIIGKDDDDLDGPSRVIAPEIEVKNDLTVGNSFSLGNLKLIIEDNGSFSFTVEK